MSDNREQYCKMSDNRETYDQMLENREKYWQFPEAALAADWNGGAGGVASRHFYFNFCLRYIYIYVGRPSTRPWQYTTYMITYMICNKCGYWNWSMLDN